MNKQPKHHEVIRPIRELVNSVGSFVVGRLVPSDVIDSLFSPPENTGGGPMLDREHAVGREVMAGEHDAQWAYERLGE